MNLVNVDNNDFDYRVSYNEIIKAIDNIVDENNGIPCSIFGDTGYSRRENIKYRCDNYCENCKIAKLSIKWKRWSK